MIPFQPSIKPELISRIPTEQEKRAFNAITYGIILTSSVDDLKKRLLQDEDFKRSFYYAIQSPPAEEIKGIITNKIVQLLQPTAYPSWAQLISQRIGEQSLTQRQLEQLYLNSCASGTSIDMSKITSGEIDPSKVRDLEGRTFLHLALLNPNFHPRGLSELTSARPDLMYLRDYEQNLPFDLVELTPIPYVVLFTYFAANAPENKTIDSPYFKAMLSYFFHLKNPEKTLSFLKDGIKWFNVTSIQELESLKDPIAECVKFGKEELALKVLSIIAQTLDIPYIVLVCTAAPQLLKAALKDEYIHLQPLSAIILDEEFASRPIIKSFVEYPLTKCCWYSGTKSYVFLLLSFRAILCTDPSLCEAFINIYKTYYPEFVLIEILLQSLSDESEEAYAIVSNLIDKTLDSLSSERGTTKKTKQMECIAKLLERTDIITKDPKKSSTRIFGELILKHLVTSDDFRYIRVLLKSLHNLFLLNDSTTITILDRMGATIPDTDQPIYMLGALFELVGFYVGSSEKVRFEKITPEKCLNIIKTICKYPKLHSGSIIPSFPKLIESEDCDAILEYLLNFYQIPDATLIEYALLASKNANNKVFNAIIRVIVSRSSSNEMLQVLCSKVFEIPNDYLRININEPLLRKLRQIEPVVTNEKIRMMLSGWIATKFPFSENCSISKDRLEQCVPSLKILIECEIPFDNILSEDKFYQALRKGELECCAFIFKHSLKMLSLNEIRKPFKEKSQAYEIFSQNFDLLISKLGSNARPILIPGKTIVGLAYEIELHPKDKTISIYSRLNNERAPNHMLFGGYITYEKLLQFIQDHEIGLHNQSILTTVQRDFANYIVDINATIEARPLNLENKKMAIKVYPNENKIVIHLLKPGGMSISIIEITFDQMRADPNTLDKILDEWKTQVYNLFAEAQQRCGASNCFLSGTPILQGKEQLHLLLNQDTGQLALHEQGKYFYNEKNTAYRHLSEAIKDWNNFQQLAIWASKADGFVIPKRTVRLTEHYLRHFIPSLEHPWAALPWIGGRAWLATKDFVSGFILCSTLTNLQGKEVALKNLRDIQSCLGGHVPCPQQLNMLVKPPSIRKHNQPANVPLSKLLDHFKKIKNAEPYKTRISKGEIPAESLESNLTHFIKVANAQRGITGWEDTQKHRQDYLDVLIYLTNTLEEMLKKKDEQALSMLVLELAKYGRYCGNKVSEICYHNYAFAFGISLEDSEASDVDSALSLSYKQAFLETIDILVQFVGDSASKQQTIHVISYLRAQLAALGYLVPEDARIAPELQDGTKDRFYMQWGPQDYPKDILETIFPAICIPLFIMKFQEAQDTMLKKEQWSSLGNLKQILMGRIEMGLEETILFPVENILEDYQKLAGKRKQSIAEAKTMLEEIEKQILQHEESSRRCVANITHLEQSLVTISSRITEVSEECLAIARKRQQIEVRIKDSTLTPPLAIPQATRFGKRSNDQAFPDFNSEEAEVKFQLDAIIRNQTLAEKCVDELKVQREAIKTILGQSEKDIAFLAKREELLKVLRQRKKDCEDILSNKSKIKELVEEWAEKEDYTKDSEPVSILSLKGLIQVLIQKNCLVPSEQLQRQWLKHNEIKAQKKLLESGVPIEMPLDQDWLLLEPPLVEMPDLNPPQE